MCVLCSFCQFLFCSISFENHLKFKEFYYNWIILRINFFPYVYIHIIYIYTYLQSWIMFDVSMEWNKIEMFIALTFSCVSSFSFRQENGRHFSRDMKGKIWLTRRGGETLRKIALYRNAIYKQDSFSFFWNKDISVKEIN